MRLALILLFIILQVAEGVDKPLREVPASEILAKIEQGLPVEYDHVIIKGNLDLNKIDLPKASVSENYSVLSKIYGKMFYNIPIRVYSERHRRHQSNIIAIFELIEEKRPIRQVNTSYSNSTKKGNIRIVASSLSIRDSEILGMVNFDNVTFINKTEFVGDNFTQDSFFSCSRFSLLANFSGSAFYKSLDFSGAQFNQSAYFKYSKFNSTHFSGSTFNESIDFSNARFNRSVCFRYCKFDGSAKFDSSISEIDSDFRESVFNKHAYFRSSLFNGTAYFSNIKFNDYTDFSAAKFIGPVVFLNTKFNDASTFSGSVFNTDAIFWNSEFNGTMISWNTEFEGIADFWDSKFNNNFDFSESKFDNDALFDESLFNGDADFSASMFNSSAFFWLTDFNKDAYFTDCYFKEIICFNQSRFSKDAYFEGSNFGSNSILYLTGSKINKIFLRWDNINKLGFDEEIYLSLIDNYRKLGWFEDADNCYYQFRKEQYLHWNPFENPLMLLLNLSGWLFYGYGKKPLYPLGWSVGSILVFGIFWYTVGIREQKDAIDEYSSAGDQISEEQYPNLSIWRRIHLVLKSLLFSATVFLSGTKLFVDPPEIPISSPWSKSFIKGMFTLERVLGAFFSILFFIAIGATIVR